MFTPLSCVRFVIEFYFEARLCRAFFMSGNLFCRVEIGADRVGVASNAAGAFA